MRVELCELLQERPIIHPTYISAVELLHDTLQLVITGHSWWTDQPGREDARVTLTFTGINVGLLDAAVLLDRTWNEALEDFDVRPLADQPWADAGAMHDVYCREPLPAPLALHAVVHDLLLNTRAPYRASHYLNGGERLAGFQRLTAKSDYLLGRFPAAMTEVVTAELKRQGVAWRMLAYDRGSSSQRFVALGEGGFVCDEAWAEWSSW